jgi:hypothetical protein
MVFWIYFHAGKWPQINRYSENYFCEGERPKIKALTSRTTPTRQLPTSWQPSRVVFVLISHACPTCWRHSLLLPHAYEGAAPGQATTCNNSSKQAQRDTGISEKVPHTPVDHAHSLPLLLSPGLSHSINVTRSPCLIKGRAGYFREAGWLVLFTSSFSSQEELSFISSWDRAPSLTHL